jgi:hypothetical protein
MTVTTTSALLLPTLYSYPVPQECRADSTTHVVQLSLHAQWQEPNLAWPFEHVVQNIPLSTKLSLTCLDAGARLGSAAQWLGS